MGDGATASLNTPVESAEAFSQVGCYSAARTQLASSRAVQAGWPEMLIAHRAIGQRWSSPVPRTSTRARFRCQRRGRTALGRAQGGAGGRPGSRRRCGRFSSTPSMRSWPRCPWWRSPHWLRPASPACVLLAAAGMFVGYRQARAASMLRAVGIARFVKSGPLGVVRSGGLVALHARSSTRRRSETRRRQDGRLESVA